MQVFRHYLCNKKGYPRGYPFCLIPNLYNKSYFEAARSLEKRSIVCLCEHFPDKADAKRALLDEFY